MKRICKQCGGPNGMVLETMDTGETEDIDICYNCIFEGFPNKFIGQQIEFPEKKTVIIDNYSEYISAHDVSYWVPLPQPPGEK